MTLNMKTSRILLLVAAISCAAASEAQARDFSYLPATREGPEFGVSISQFGYEEPGYMNLEALNLGAEISYTKLLTPFTQSALQHLYLTGKLSYAFGQASYNNSAGVSASDLNITSSESRVLIGKDLRLGAHVISPFVGIGHRRLYNDLRPLPNGYRRVSDHTFTFIGVNLGFNNSSVEQVWSVVEYMQLASGHHHAQLSDINAGSADVRLSQSGGRGIKIEIMKRDRNWTIGPFIVYWDIPQSEVAGSPAVFEPKNRTLEVGVKFKRHF